MNGRGGELWVTRERSEMGVSLLWYWSLWTAHHGGFVEDHCRDPSCLHARITQGCSANFKEKKKTGILSENVWLDPCPSSSLAKILEEPAQQFLVKTNSSLYM